MTSNRSPNQDDSDQHFEGRLRAFRPAAPPQLATPRYSARWRMLAYTAIFLLVTGISFLVPHQHPAVQHTFTSPPFTLGTLNAALLDNDETFNRTLDDASPNILPRGQRGTVLYELSKE